MQKHSPFDPCGHIKLSVSKFDKSYLFYKGIFDLLQYGEVSHKEKKAGWVSPDGYGISISQAEIIDYEYKFLAPGLHHLCLKADVKEKVDQVHQFVSKEGVLIFDTPQAYPEYTDKYYAVFFADLDGIKIEIAYY